MVCLSWGHHKFRCNMVQRHKEGRPGTGREEKEGAGVGGQLHNRLLRESSAAHAYAKVVRSLPSGKGGSKQDWFAGKPIGNLLTEGTLGAFFEILQAPVVSTGGKQIPSLVFIDPGSNINFITHELAGQL